MEDFCPLCLKKGIKNEIKLFQINLEEGVWLCKDEECVWPFRYKDFVFCPRPVGKVWSCYWDDYKPSNYKEKVTSSPSKSVLCRTSAIYTQDRKMIEMTSSSDIRCLKNINNISSSSNVTDLKSFNNLYTSGFEESSTIPNIDIEKDSSENILNKEITAVDTNVQKSILQPIDNNIEVENEWINSLNKHIKGKDNIFTGNNEDNVNNVRGTPKIISIESTNIDLSNVKLASQTSNVKLKNETSVRQKSVGITETELKSEVEKLELSEDNENILKPNLNTTTMEIDGLPPITLSFEVPVCTTAPKTVIANTRLTSYKNNDIRPNNLEVKNTFVKRNITSGKQYEKFNFNAIKKNLESNNFNNSDIQNNSSNMTQIQKVEDDLPEVISNVSPTYVSNQLDKSSSSKVGIQIQKAENNSQGIISDVNISVPNQFNKSEIPSSSQNHITSDIAALNTSTNIDTVLDSLTKNYEASAPEDEWIISLLN